MFLIRLLLILLVAGGISAAAQSSKDDYTVTGRVVDELGNPRSGAGICLEPKVYKSKSFERFVECVGTSAEGKFSIEISRNKETKGETYSLFVYVDKTRGTRTSVTPPFDGLRVREPSFEGFPVQLGRSSLIDVGDVKVQFFYGSVTLEVPWAMEKPIDWLSTFLVVRTERGHLAEAETLSTEDVETLLKDRGTRLDVSLPTGRWKIELVNVDSELKFGESEVFEVSAGENATVQIRQVTPVKVPFR